MCSFSSKYAHDSSLKKNTCLLSANTPLCRNVRFNKPYVCSVLKLCPANTAISIMAHLLLISSEGLWNSGWSLEDFSCVGSRLPRKFFRVPVTLPCVRRAHLPFKEISHTPSTLLPRFLSCYSASLHFFPSWLLIPLLSQLSFLTLPPYLFLFPFCHVLNWPQGDFFFLSFFGFLAHIGLHFLIHIFRESESMVYVLVLFNN